MTGSLQVKSGKYYAVLNFRDSNGTRIQKWISLNLEVKGNKRKAEALLNELVVNFQGFEAIEPMNLLFSQHVAQWLEANRPNIAQTTYDQYLNILHIHIKPYFDARGITVSKLTAGDLEDYYTFKVSSGLSPNTVIKHHAMMRTALQWGVKHRYIKENVADFADKPAHIRYQGEEPYTIQEIATLYLTSKFAQTLKKYGLRPIRFHDLRHSCATIMLYLGYSLKDIQTWLGHSNYNFTADIYIHSCTSAHEQMALSMSERLGELLPQNLLTPFGTT